MSRPENEARNDEIIRRKRAGQQPRQIAREMGLSKGVVIGVTNRAGLAVPGADRENQLCGEEHSHAKLTARAVREMRARYRRGSKADGSVALAKEFGIARSTVRKAITGRSWAHVQ